MLKNGLLVGVLLLGLAAVAQAWDSTPPKLYLGLTADYDREENDTDIGFSMVDSGERRLSSSCGRHDGKWLLGMTYMLFGRRADLQSFYGGVGAIYYGGDFGPSVTLGTHLSRETIAEVTYQKTSDWDGTISLLMGYGVDWTFFQ